MNVSTIEKVSMGTLAGSIVCYGVSFSIALVDTFARGIFRISFSAATASLITSFGLISVVTGTFLFITTVALLQLASCYGNQENAQEN